MGESAKVLVAGRRFARRGWASRALSPSFVLRFAPGLRALEEGLEGGRLRGLGLISFARVVMSPRNLSLPLLSISWHASKTLHRIAARISPDLPRLPRIGLAKVFGFDRWHTSVIWEREYAQAVVRHLNARTREGRRSAVEIGCGLGDIVRRLRYERRLGLDIDTHVLRAARLLGATQKALRFEQFQFPATPLDGMFDVIIMVNWIHHVEPDRLRDAIERRKNVRIVGAEATA
ncbi:MAG TPA: class I SAM-dependent methyltransferase [Gaiellaceae bacterium]|nr:class I SAM-dependent methyltransferase [Gaiellaceae bacterium]